MTLMKGKMKLQQFIKQENIKWYSPGLWIGLIVGYSSRFYRIIYCYLDSFKLKNNFQDQIDLQEIQLNIAGKIFVPGSNWDNLFWEEISEQYNKPVNEAKRTLLKQHRLMKNQ